MDKKCSDCGKNLSLPIYTRCGSCSRKQGNRKIDITGKKFGRLTVIKMFGNDKWGELKWLCSCDCGKKIVIVGSRIRSGHTKSCGCYATESLKKRATTHGMKHTKFYSKWCSMWERCNNPNQETFKKYGAKGIKLLWKSFEEFRDDMHESYLAHVKEFGEKQTQIDRINFSGHYCKENCRWVTLKEQASNKSNNRYITFNGTRLHISDWAKRVNIDRVRITRRIDELGWSIEKALTTPIKRI